MGLVKKKDGLNNTTGRTSPSTVYVSLKSARYNQRDVGGRIYMPINVIYFVTSPATHRRIIYTTGGKKGAAVYLKKMIPLLLAHPTQFPFRNGVCLLKGFLEMK